MKLSKEQSDILYIMKFFAVISIVFAHSTIANIDNIYLKTFLSIFKCVGVYIFFILAGYFYNYKKYNSLFEMLKSKFKSIILPWLFCGLLVYFVQFIHLTPQLNLFKITNWILGNGTYLYYMTMLLMIYIIIYLCPKKRKCYYIFIVLNIISIIITQFDIIPNIVDTNRIAFSYCNPYLNVFNWIGIFSFGLLLKEYGLFKLKCNETLLNILLVILTGIILIFKVEVEYWNFLVLFIEILLFFFIFNISKKLYKFNLLVKIGKSSFPIYLLHMPIIGKICSVMNPNFSIFGAIITVFILYFSLLLADKISKKLYLNKIFHLLSGFR